MKPLIIGKGIKWMPTGIAGRRRERFFYIGIAIVIVGVVFGGFARTYFLRPYFTSQPLMPLLHLHGIVFTSWLVLYLTQTLLVAAKRTDIHRRLGIAGAVIAVLMVLIGTITAIIRAQQGATPTEGLSPLVFLVIPLADMLVFAILIGAGFYFRRQPDVHKKVDASCDNLDSRGGNRSTAFRLSPSGTAGFLWSNRPFYCGVFCLRPYHARANSPRYSIGRLANRRIAALALDDRRH